MFGTLFWIFFCSILTLLSAKINYDDLPETAKLDMQNKWEECCEKNFCLYNSCYIVQRSASRWSTARQRCQNQYPEWPYSVDILRIRNETDLGKFWNMLQDPIFSSIENPKTIWTSGTRCPKASSNGTKLVTLWTSINQQFPSWLDETINRLFNISGDQWNDCKFLVISLAPNYSDVKYDFKGENEKYASICEFSVPGVEWTPKSETTTPQTHLSPTETEIKQSSFQWTTVTQVSSEKSIGSVTTTSSYVPKQRTETSVPSSTSTSTPKRQYCKGVNESGISWPDTEGGVTVRKECPIGMIGFIEWECDENTYQFWPKKPRTEGCKHEWINDLEDSIRERDDAVQISTKLSKETKHNNMSHGDIIALVNLTTNLFRLYTEQKGEEEFEMLQNEEMPVYYNFTKSVISSISNILRVEIKEAWEGLNESRQTKEASTILRLVTTMGSRLSCIKTSTENLQFTVSEENIDLQTFILNNTKESSDVIVFPQETDTVKSNSSITLPANLKLEKWYSPCKTYSSAVGVIYKHVGDFLKSGQLNSSTKVATKVLSFSISNNTESISLTEGKVNITLQHLKAEAVQDQILMKPRCVFWNFSKSIFGEWDESGCQLLSFNETHTVCQCSHLTNFAVLMDINDNIQDDKVLTLMTYVCCGFSSLTLLITLICFSVIRSLHGRRSIITGNLCFSLLITNVLIIFGLDKTQNKILCAVLAGVLHYWILSAFCWMLVEGYHLYRMVILVFQRGSNLPVKFYYMFAYGAPLIVVAVSAGIRNEGYGGTKYCWLSADDRGLMWSFVGPACAIILINIIIFILTLRSASSVKIKREQSTVRKIKSWIRGSISVMCLLGLTWCIGLFYINKELHFFSYIFTFLNGLQGVFIFLFHILLNDKVNTFFWKENKMYGRKKHLNHTSSNQTQSKTSTKTSVNSTGCTSSTRLPQTRNLSLIPLTRCSDGSNGNVTSLACTNTLNGNITESSADAKSYKKKVAQAISVNGLKQSTKFYNGKTRIRSSSASNSGLCKMSSSPPSKSSTVEYENQQSTQKTSL